MKNYTKEANKKLSIYATIAFIDLGVLPSPQTLLHNLDLEM